MILYVRSRNISDSLFLSNTVSVVYITNMKVSRSPVIPRNMCRLAVTSRAMQKWDCRQLAKVCICQHTEQSFVVCKNQPVRLCSCLMSIPTTIHVKTQRWFLWRRANVTWHFVAPTLQEEAAIIQILALFWAFLTNGFSTVVSIF